jgi:peptidylprolyl isomerase
MKQWSLMTAAVCLSLAGGVTMAHAAKMHSGHSKLGQTVTMKDGLKYRDIGASPKQGQTVVVDYIGTLTSGQKFDASRDHGGPFSFTIGVGQVIKGWDQGVMTMKVGGERILTVPPSLGYGAAGAGGVIPPNATLIFDVKLLGIH